MSVKKLKQKLAVALIIAMSTGNMLSAAAAPATGKPSKNAQVKITFTGGEKGYWDKEVAVLAVASPSSAEIIGTASNASQKIERIYDLTKEADLRDDQDYPYINLKETQRFKGNNGTDWEKVHRDDDYELLAWYDGKDYLDPASSVKQLYNGAELEAVWQPKEITWAIDNRLKNDLFENKMVIAEGLENQQKFVLNPADTNTVTKDFGTHAVENALRANKGQKLKLAGNTEEIIKLDIHVGGFKDGQKPITVKLPINSKKMDLNGLGTKFDLYAIHFKADKTTEVLPVTIEGGTYMVFSMSSFSPVYIVKAEKDHTQDKETVKVLIENVEYGYIEAYTYNEDGYSVKYLPVGEEVELPAGTNLHMTRHSYSYGDVLDPNSGRWQGRFQYLEVIPMDGGKEGEPKRLENFSMFKPTQDCKIRAKFDKVLSTYNDLTPYAAQFRIDLNKTTTTKLPAAINPGEFQAVADVKRWNPSSDAYIKMESFSGWELRMATKDDVEKILKERLKESDFTTNQINEAIYNVLNNTRYSFDAFTFNPQTLTVTNIKPLELGKSYDIPFVITYEGRDYLFHEKEFENNGEIYLHSHEIRVGSYVAFFHQFVDIDPLSPYTYADLLDYESSAPFQFNYREDMTWKEISDTDKYLTYGPPQMYNYEFAGWKNYEGTPYTPDTKLKRPEGEDDYAFYAYSRFVNKDNKEYRVKALGMPDFGTGGSDDNNSSDDDNNNDSNDNKNHGSSTSSGNGGGSRRHPVNPASRPMHGKWIMNGNRWTFVKDSGETAVNTWGFINNQWYYFDAQGNMVTGWFQVNGKWYYLNPTPGANEGKMSTGWQYDPAYFGWFYLNPDGSMATGWKQINGTWYYFNAVSDGNMGRMAANTTIDGYTVNADGAWVK